jgi:hypothetical protein
MFDQPFVLADNRLAAANFETVTTVDSDHGYWLTSPLGNNEEFVTPQLQPPARFVGEVGVEFEWQGSSGMVAAVALLGVTGANSMPLQIELRRWVGNWETVPARWILSTSTPFSPQHLVGILDQATGSTKWQIKLSAQSNGFDIGAVYFAGKMWAAQAAADDDWQVRIEDLGASVRSQGGQQYSSNLQLVRRLVIPQNSLSAADLWGTPQAGRPIELGDLSVDYDDWSPITGGWRLTPSGPTPTFHQAHFSGLLEVGKQYLLRVDVAGKGLTEYLSPTFLRLMNGESYGVGRHSVVFTADEVDLRISGVLGIPSAYLDVRVLSLNELAAPAPSTSLAEIIALSGRTNPVIAVLRPRDPAMSPHTTIYGLIDTIQPWVHLGGDTYRAGLVIIESL